MADNLQKKAVTGGIKGRWERFTPKQKQLALYGALGLVLLFVAQVFMSPPKNVPAGPKKSAPDRTVFTDVNAKQLGFDALAGKLQSLQDDNKKLAQQLTQLQSRDESLQRRGQEPPAVDVEAIKAQVRDEVLDEVKKNPPPSARAATDVNPFESPLGGDNRTTQPYTFTQEKPTSGSGQASAPAPSLQPGGNGASTSAPAIRDISGEGDQASATPSSRNAKLASSRKGQGGEEKVSDTKDYIPAGAFLHSVLLTGMEAPTGKKLQSDPYPALTRVDTDTILPNFHRADMRQCFILANGLGDLSSERAYLRATSLSCIREDGGVIEVPIKAFAVGEDGKLGLRGRLVDKQGQMIARALVAGVAQGFSSIFNRQAVPTISTSASGTVQYQSQFTPDALQSAGAQGFGNALDRVAKFYEDLASNLFPVIEVDAERHCDWVLTAGLSLENLKAVTSETPLEPVQTESDGPGEPVQEPIRQTEVVAQQRAPVADSAQ